MKKLTSEQIKTYLIDCVGYSNEDLENLKSDELWDLIVNEKDLKNFSE